MIYHYDKAICSNLVSSFNQDETQGVVVKVIDPEQAISVAAQVKDDQIGFPLIVLTRSPDYQLDKSRMNFTAQHKGVQTVMDTDTNMIYNERVLPITLDYSLTVLTTNTADMDEITRELLFKYTSMFFLTIQVPYESKRKIRFGVCIDREQSIQRSSSAGQYLEKGALYQSIIPLQIHGAVLLHYVPFHMKRLDVEYELVTPTPKTVMEPGYSKPTHNDDSHDNLI